MTSTIHRAPLPLALALLAFTGACAHHSGAANDSGTVQHASAPVNVFVTNHYSLPMEVIASASGANHRLGVVSPEVEGHFVLPMALVSSGGQVEFLAVPSGQGPVARSGLVMVIPGDVVEFVIGAQLFNSTATVKR